MTGPLQLPPIGYAGRAERVLAGAPDVVDALAVTDPTSVRWLTGFTGSNATVALLPDRIVLVTFLASSNADRALFNEVLAR